MKRVPTRVLCVLPRLQALWHWSYRLGEHPWHAHPTQRGPAGFKRQVDPQKDTILAVAGMFLRHLAGGDLAQSAINTSGNVLPSYPGGDPWNVGGPLCVAYSANGSMTVNGGSDVINTDGSLGYLAGATGTVTVTGSGSTGRARRSFGGTSVRRRRTI